MNDLLNSIPIRFDPAPNSWMARPVPFDRTDARWDEPLVDLAQMGLRTWSWYARVDGGNAPYHAPIPGAIPIVAVRMEVACRLQQADWLLKPYGLCLMAVDGYRSIETQKGLWDFFETKIARDNPGIARAALDEKVRTFVSDPRQVDPQNERTWPLHSTGGAVDVLLVNDMTGNVVDHGAEFDEADERSYTDHYERLFQAGKIEADDPRLINRRVLVNAMFKAGFTNYAYEFWHFDFGTQLYVLTHQKAKTMNAPIAAW